MDGLEQASISSLAEMSAPTRPIQPHCLKLSHPEIIPTRDRMAAPLRLALWISFEAAMDRRDWRQELKCLHRRHLPDEALLQLLGRCAPDQGITSMEEALSRAIALIGSLGSQGISWPPFLFFFLHGALCVPRGTSHRDEFKWGGTRNELDKHDQQNQTKPQKPNTTPSKNNQQTRNVWAGVYSFSGAQRVKMPEHL